MGKDYCSKDLIIMPKEIKELKEFTQYFTNDKTQKKESKKTEEKEKHHPKTVFTNKMIIKYSKKDTKFKLRTAKQLLTYKTSDQKTVKRILNSLPPQLARVEIKKKTQNKRKGKKN